MFIKQNVYIFEFTSVPNNCHNDLSKLNKHFRKPDAKNFLLYQDNSTDEQNVWNIYS